jgi:serine/threonine protein kinase
MQTAQGFRLNEIVANYRKQGELPSYLLAVDWFDRAFRALAAMHATGRIHRSIGLEKVLVGGDDEVSIDEGPAANLGDSITLAGPANYAAPEQIAGRAVDQRSDVYSLGAVFYELLTLRRPGSYPDPPSSINVTVPKGFDAIVFRALAAEPDERYASADEVLADLDAFRRSPAARVLAGGMMPTSGPVRPAGVPRAAMIAAGAILGAVIGTIAGLLLHSFIAVTVLVGAIVGGVVGSFAKTA